ncbi:MAG: ImmA/IrrE family metallo-endopeptidase [Phycisphaerales bacterium]
MNNEPNLFGPGTPEPGDQKPIHQPKLHLVPLMRKVENAAWRMVLDCMAKEGRESVCLPVPVERWIEGPLGLKLEIADLSEFDQGGLQVLGATDFAKRTIRISQRIVEQENRFRFTLAHELGHFKLHSFLSGKFRDTTDGDYLSDKFEREADRFAAAFLMPANSFRQELPRYCGQHGQVAAELLAAVSSEHPSATTILLNDIIPKLSRRFGVAATTAMGRFRDLQIDGLRPMIPYRVVTKLLKRISDNRGNKG